jgi:hypothetical protein
LPRPAVTAHFGKGERELPGVKKIARKCPRIAATVKIMHEDYTFIPITV